MLRSFWASLLASIALGACTDAGPRIVTLSNNAGKLSLRYACASEGPVPLEAGLSSLIRGAVLADVSEHVLAAPPSVGHAEHVAAVRQAQASNDLAALESAVASYVCAYGNPPSRPPRFPEPGSTPPDFTLSRLEVTAGADAAMVQLSEHAGRPVVLVFWSSWCGPCRKEYEELQRVAQRGGAEGFSVYAIIYRDGADEVRRWREQHGADVPFLLDQDEKTARAYGVRGVPYTVVVGADGRVRSAWPGGGVPGLWERKVVEALANAPAA